ncbi:MAG: 30S ribosome-binding factor RbfA [Candidatus Didemnitutus sp.]|nr:30S ribosome-binding factor RbfA [Candidatus Didemnitutus sp.]
MSNRLLRVNALLQQEISSYLRKRYTSEATRLTISGADVTGDLREAKIFYTIIGNDEEEIARAGKFLRSKLGEIRSMVAKNVVMRHVPLLSVHHDASGERAVRIEQLLDEIEVKERKE